MEMTEIFISVIAGLVGIVAFFLARNMSKTDLTHEITIQNKMDIALLKQETDLNYKHLNEKIDGLIKTVNEINYNLKK